MATGRVWASKVDSEPVCTSQADMYGGARTKQALGAAARGIEGAAGRYGQVRSEAERAGALINRLGNLGTY